MMGPRRNRLRWSPFAAAAGALVATALTACSRGGATREATEIRPWQIENTLAAEVIVAKGGSILRCAAEARADIHRGYLLRAEEDIDRADDMLDSIEQSMPAAEARHRIWIARRHLEYADIRDVSSDLTPIHAAVERIESAVPADSIRHHLERTKQHLEKGNREAAGRELARADQELLLVSVDLPLSSTRHHLAKAREALAVGEPDRANAALQQAEDDLAFLTASARSPLGAARWSLEKAVAAYTKGDSAGAEQYLILARQSLERASANASGAARTTAKGAVDDLRELEGRLAHRTDALEKLEQLVDRIQVLVHSS